MSCTINFAGARLELLADRAIWWPAESALLVADVHLGKPASFRADGAPVPEAVTGADLDRLTALVSTHRAARLVVLGDLVHDARAWEATTLRSVARWRETHAPLDVVLIRGNHDRRALGVPESLRITSVDAGWRLGGIELHHDPAAVGGGPALCGHLHPGVRLQGAGRGRGLRAPCFWFGQVRGVLPAFGSFTGCAMIRPGPGDRVYAVGAGRIAQVALAAAR